MNPHRLLVTALALIIVGTVGVLTTSWLWRAQTGEGGWVPMTMMMGMGMHGPRMGAMMHEMMGGRLPPGLDPEALPEPESPGARLLARYCTPCHNLPAPAMHTAEEWPAVAARMFNRMTMMWGRGGMGRMMARWSTFKVPTDREQELILGYLQEHGLRPASGASLGPDAPGLDLFRQTCSRCHALPNPTLHTADEWPAVVERMRKNMGTMGRRVITQRERDTIVNYLATRAAS